ncbi:NAD(P)/FAD-dependent oxidoreductase [Pseudomarimonas salicorniae]|uniref:FAD-dependent oxidoreductase n=1 Tax=Pseudomarimonas salicorniae TaxID=2933270 RepID=A0ABT0GKW5_9GAMM|nr:FAD-dependent oxidoreductase [Lysobacter sp. CAU 1642]MCK7595176.1 FAD-dependent oxidoreductase [Lysobacter sp. CAU 1642]
MEASAKDILVAGGGVIGLSCALELLERGREVTVIDAGRLGGGASHGNCGTITPSHAPPLAGPGVIGQALRWMLRSDAPLYIRPRWDPMLWRWLLGFAARCNRRDWLASSQAKGALLTASRRALQDWVERFGLECEFRPSGLIYAFRTQRMFDEHAGYADMLRQLGVETEVWAPERLRAEEPALKDGMAGGLHFPGDACLRPDALVRGLAQRVRERGGEIVEGCSIDRVSAEPRRAWVALSDGRQLDARHLVLATGAWSPRWSRQLGLRIPIQPGKGYSMTYERPDQAPRRPLVLKERSVCVTAWGSGFRLGSTMEFSGYDDRLDPVRLGALERGASEYLHQPTGPSRVEQWYGWRPMCVDDLPLIGPLPGRESVLVATGHGMMGVSMSTATAQLVGAMVCGDALPVDAHAFRPERFH